MSHSQPKQHFALFRPLKARFHPKIEAPATLPQALVEIVDPRSPYLWGVFGCGFFALSAWGNFFYDWVVNGFALDWSVLWWMLLSTVILVFIGVLCYWKDWLIRERRATDPMCDIANTSYHDIHTAKHYPGMIVALSPDNPGATETAVHYHTHPKVPIEQRLRYCWCITERTNEMKTGFETFAQSFQETGVEFIHCPIRDIKSIQAVYEMVNTIYHYHIHEKHLTCQDVVTDITPGRKPISVGMALACLQYDRNIEYIQASRMDGTPDEILEHSEVVNIDINFYLAQL